MADAQPYLEEPTHQQAAKDFLAGAELTLKELNQLCSQCLKANDVSTARALLERARTHEGALRDLEQATGADLDRMRIREALFTSKDPELSAALRHDEALRLLALRFGRLDDPLLTAPELLGVAGGICKRRWQDLGQLVDLKRAAAYYERGARAGLGNDAYCQINAAFLDDLLASLGDDRESRMGRAKALRERIVAALPKPEQLPEDSRWWNTASRAEALFGLGYYAEATACMRSVQAQAPAPWELETMVRQLSQLAHLQHERPLENLDVRAFFDTLIPGGSLTMLGAVMGRVGLALSGGGFRASFFHLGMLARLAELDVLRHVSVLSCVSGGSIVGACYWMLLRERLEQTEVLTREDYIALVQDLIEHFSLAVDVDLRARIQPSKARVAWRVFVDGQRGALDPERAAEVLNAWFYRPIGDRLSCSTQLNMHELRFDPKGHREQHGRPFNPGVDNWLRRDKVPVLVLNATTVNTGHAWQFTPTWMGESPWAVHEAADAVPRLEWAWYDNASAWEMPLARAVGASACVPGIFAPVELDGHYEGDVKVRLVDGGVHDNQGTVALLAHSCNIILVSDACGQLLFESEGGQGLSGLGAYGKRAMDILMERVRQANFADLSARRQVGLLRTLMFVHMKAGLDSDVLRRTYSQRSFSVRQSALTSSGVRKDFQKTLAELRTDLDDFTEDERLALMACGYRMGTCAVDRDIADVPGLAQLDAPLHKRWVFLEMLEEICSTRDQTPKRSALLQKFAHGTKVRI